MNVECTLKPRYKGKQCPCVTCILKMVCKDDYYSCDVYREYCLYQNPDMLQEDCPLPCEDCPTCDICFNKVHELGDKVEIGIEFVKENYHIINWVLELKANTFFRNLLMLLQKDCKTLKTYFPYRVMMSSDKEVRASYPNLYRNQILKYLEWTKREALLWNKFDVYEIIQKKITLPKI
jgi:hypothetical protein